MKIGKHDLKYIINTEGCKNSNMNFSDQVDLLNYFIPIFFRENTIQTDSDVSAEAISSNEIKLRPFGNNKIFWAYDKYNEPWKTKHFATILSNTIEGVRFTLYDMKP